MSDFSEMMLSGLRKAVAAACLDGNQEQYDRLLLQLNQLESRMQLEPTRRRVLQPVRESPPRYAPIVKTAASVESIGSDYGHVPSGVRDDSVRLDASPPYMKPPAPPIRAVDDDVVVTNSDGTQDSDVDDAAARTDDDAMLRSRQRGSQRHSGSLSELPMPDDSDSSSGEVFVPGSQKVRCVCVRVS